MPLAKNLCSTKPGQKHFASQIIFYQILECLFSTQRQNFPQVKTLLKAMYRLICYKRQCKVNRDLCVVYNKQLIKFGLGAFRTLFLSVYFFCHFITLTMALPLLQKIGQNIVTQNEHISQFPVFLQFFTLALIYIAKKCNGILRNSIKLVQYLLFTNFLYRQSG